MKKPIKYLIAILICCISTALLVFGVYSARQISYSLSGTINYEVNSLYTDVTTSLYALNLPFEQNEVSVNSKMHQLQNSLSESKPLPENVVKISDLNNYSTMGNGISTENTLTASEKFSINYGDYIQDSQVPTSPAFYLVFEVKNYSSATISALLDLTNLIENTTNTLTDQTMKRANIYGKTTGQEFRTCYFVVELSFDKPSLIRASNFDNITFTVNKGELVTTPQSQFTFTTSGDTATITKYNGTDTDVVIPSHLEDGKTVTTIGDSAFKDNTTIKSVYIPNTIKSLYSYAFYNCTNLTIVDIQGSSLSSIGDYAFYECSSLTSINMPESVESIGYYAFYNCTSLMSITIPESVKSIGYYAFRNCNNLKNANYLGSVNDWLKISFESSYYSNPLYNGADLYINGELLTKISEDDFVGLTAIKSYAFYNCESLTSVTIPESVESIGSSAFSGCSNLKEVNYLGSINDWLKISFGNEYSNPLNNGANLYINGELLTEITEDDFVDANGNKTTKINSYAFYYCTSLISVTIPECVESIESSAFGICSNLKEVNYLGSVNDWLKISFDNRYSNPLNEGADLYINGELLTEFTEDDFVGLTAIKSYTFCGCESLLNVTVPNTIESIGSYAFYNCTSLTSITLPNSINSIGSYAFSGCSKLSSITILNSVTSIGSNAFYSCTNLKEVNYIGSTNGWLKISFSSSSSNPLYYGADLYINGKFLTEITEDDFVDGAGNKITKINSYTFYNCKNLTRVTLPSSVRSIGSSAFEGCSKLSSITIQESIESIGSSAFEDCTCLTNITLPNSINSIGSSAFYDCNSLKEVKYLGSVNDWLKISFSTSFSNPLNYGAYLYINGELLTEVTEDDFVDATGNKITKINSYVFYNCASLTCITIPNSVTSIGSQAFYNCSNLKLVFNLSNIDIVAGSSSNGYVGNYAKQVINAMPNLDNFYEDETGEHYKTDDGTIITLVYTLTIPDGTTTITQSLVTSLLPEGVNRSDITKVIIPNSVTNMGSYAFDDCDNIKEVYYLGLVNDWLKISFGSSYYSNPLYYGADLYIDGDLLTEITENDFAGLTTINSCTFYGCESLLSVTIPDSITSIGNYVFYGCSSLTIITIPNSVTSIGSYAFDSCTNLKEVALPTNESFNTINDYTFFDCRSLTSITIPKSVTSIGSCAFSRCNGLRSITISESVESIGSSAFDYCRSLTSIKIPESVKSIGGQAFQMCTSLKDVNYLGSVNDWLKINFGNNDANPLNNGADLYINGELLTEITEDDFVGLTEVKSYAFRGCESLLIVTIPNSVTSIGSGAFVNCDNLKEVYYLGSVNDWLKIGFGDYDANPLYNGAYLYINGELLTEITEDDFVGLTAIKSYVFYGCESLLSITIPNSITSIGSYAFYSCSKLSIITIPNSVTSVGDYAFYSCNQINEVNYIGSVNDWLKISFGSYYSTPLYYGADLYINGELLTEITEDDFVGLTAINSYVFYGCESLISVTIPNTIENIGSYAFYNCNSFYRVVVENETVLKGLTGTSSSVMGGLLSGIDDVLDRIYVLNTMEANIPDYIKSNWVQLNNTETIDGKEYIIFRHA